MEEDSIDNDYLKSIRGLFRDYKSLSDKAIEQVPDSEFFSAVNTDSNSIAILVKHMAGNLRSRWRVFLTTDGEKEDRDRDNEFIIKPSDTRESLMTAWDTGWAIALASLEDLKSNDSMKTIIIRSEPHSVIEAINRALTHAAYHAGQFALLAKQYVGSDWKTLSIARGNSSEFLDSKKKKFGKIR